MDKKKVLRNIAETFGPQYDSDKDLTAEERKKIRYSENPKKTRKKIWEERGLWDKTKKMVKSAYYGDKRDKNN